MTNPSASSRAANPAFACLTLRVPDSESGERVAAEAFEAGAAGSEERDGPEGKRVLLYVPIAQLEAVRRAVLELSVPGIVLLGEAAVPDENWSEAWKDGLCVLEISPRLRVRPSFVAAGALPEGQAELVIDPAQAFGTGAHESTGLALECIDSLAPLEPATRVLDVGAGTGVLALAALRLGAARAVAFDIDPLAGAACLANALGNGLADRVASYAGPIEALHCEPFALVLANLLKREVLPLLPAIAARVARGGKVVFAGLLVSERAEVVQALEANGLAVCGQRTRVDASGVEWLGLIAEPRISS